MSNHPFSDTIALRGHHFLCTLHYQGAGYSAGFTDNFTALCQHIQDTPDVQVRVAPMADEVCRACPSLQDDAETCAYQTSVMRRDRALLDEMGWQAGTVMPLREAHLAVLAQREHLMAKVCPGCDWLPRCLEKGPYGIASPLNESRSKEFVS